MAGAGVSIEELAAHVGLSLTDLDTRCEEEDLSELSLLIPVWSKVAPFLKLTDADIEDIDSESSKSRVKALNMLKKWKGKLAFRATFKVLVEVFLKLGDAEMAEKVCGQLKKHKAPPKCSGPLGSEEAIDGVSNGSGHVPKGKEFNRRNVDRLLTDVMEWEELGENLSLPKNKLKEIGADLCYKGISRQKSAMLDLWFRYDTGASWAKLSTVLEEMGEKVLAEKIRTDYMTL